MGTRNVIGVYQNGEYKVGQYGQWDGYPSGQGLDVLHYLRDHANLEQFKENVSKCSWVDDEKFATLWEEFGVTRDQEFVSCDISDKFNKKYPQFDRSTEAKILKMIEQSGNGLLLRNSIDFAHDSLMCEWVYVIDLDKNTFEVYEGFNTELLDKTERFYSEEPPYEAHNKTEYYSVKHKVTFNLNELPSDEVFLNICEPKDEQEDD